MGRDANAKFRETIREAGANARRDGFAQEPSVCVNTRCIVEYEGVLERHDVALHTLYFGYVRNPAGTVTKPRNMNDEVYG